MGPSPARRPAGITAWMDLLPAGGGRPDTRLSARSARMGTVLAERGVVARLQVAGHQCAALERSRCIGRRIDLCVVPSLPVHQRVVHTSTTTAHGFACPEYFTGCR